jgi:hypothetical protein
VLLELGLVGCGETPAPGAGVEGADEPLARPVDVREGAGRRGPALLAAEALDVALELSKPRQRDAAAEPGGGGLFQAVSLVEDDGVVLGKDRRAVGARPKREVGEVESVIDYHELRFARALPRLLGEAALDERAAPPRTALRTHGELGPKRVRGLELELRSVARVRRLDPVLQPLEVGGVLRRAEEPAQLVDPLQALAAEVILATFEDDDPHRTTERRCGGRHVLRQELLLQRLRRRGDDHPLAGDERRDEIRQALPCPRTGLGDEVVAALERIRHCVREGLLRRPRLEAGEGAGQTASGSEEGIHGGRRA